jgi:putative endonuclease
MRAWLDKLLDRLFPRSLGARGERLAARYARKTLGFSILARNVRSPDGEIDLIALDGQCLVFIEVRTRASDAFGAPETSIRSNKRRFLIRAARWYLRRHRVKNLSPRFDVIAIIWPAEGEPVIRHHRSVFGMGN